MSFVPIPDFPNYWINKRGEVKTRKRQGSAGGLIKLKVNHDGYLVARLMRNGKRYDRFAHVLVLTTFVGKRPAGKECRHKDNNRANNHLSNLSWATHKRNCSDSWKFKTIYYGERHWATKLSDEQVKAIRKARACGVTCRELGKKFNVSSSYVSVLARNVNRTKVWTV